VFVPSGSFSPLGRRLALSTADGHLRILAIGGSMEAPDDSVVGFHPAWSPGGNWIYFGGALVSQGAKPSRPLLERASLSVADWRPDGKRLAVSSNGRLWIFDTTGMDAQAVPGPKLKELRDKVKLLQDLLNEGFLDKEEYNTRYSNLLNRYGY
jgi:WD40 repeat protein